MRLTLPNMSMVITSAPCLKVKQAIEHPDQFSVGTTLKNWSIFGRRQHLDAHFEHERSDVTPSRMDALARQLVAQHPCAHEGMLQVQLVELAHEHQISEWKRQLLERAAEVFGTGAGVEPVNLAPLHAKIGQLALENDFLERALTKAGLARAQSHD